MSARQPSPFTALAAEPEGALLGVWRIAPASRPERLWAVTQDGALSLLELGRGRARRVLRLRRGGNPLFTLEDPAGRPSWLLYAAAQLTPTAVHVCTAGDLRVHLLRDGALAHVTRDHGTKVGLSLKRLRERVLRIPARLLLHGRRVVLVIGQAAAPWWHCLWKRLMAFQAAPAG